MKILKLITTTLVISLLSKVSIGQEIKYSDLSTATKESKGSYKSYVASDGSVYKIGDKIKIGYPSSSNKSFTYITSGDGVLIPIMYLPASFSGSETEILDIWVYGNKRTGYFVGFTTKGAPGFGKFKIYFENALSNGEVKSFGKSSDEALAELKKAKDKLDLGLITQEEFDNIKSELSKYID
jgi:hypothetical protein